MRRVLLAFAVVLLAAGAAGANAAGWAHCGSDPTRIRFNIETRGLGCTTARSVAQRLQRFSTVEVVLPHREFSYEVANGWLCYYRTVHSTKAQDGELAYFDCRTTEGVSNGGMPVEIRWTDVPSVPPVELLPPG